MMNTIKEKMRSWPMWLAMAALIGFLVKTFGGIDISTTMNDFLNVLLPVLVGFGIVNNPNERKKFWYKSPHRSYDRLMGAF